MAGNEKDLGSLKRDDDQPEQPTIHLEPGELDEMLLDDSLSPEVAEVLEVGRIVKDVARRIDTDRVGILLDSLIIERESIINLCREHNGGYSFLPSGSDDESMDGVPFFFTISQVGDETALFLHFENCKWELSSETSTIDLSRSMFDVVNIAYGRFVLTEKVEAMCRLLRVI